MEFCLLYDYVGASWDGDEITCFTWGRVDKSTLANDVLIPHSVSSLVPECEQRAIWEKFEDNSGEIYPFSCGFERA